MRILIEFAVCLILTMTVVAVGVPHILPQQACFCATLPDGSKMQIGQR